MLYTLLKKTRTRMIQDDPEDHVGRGDFVWRTFKEARQWRDEHDPHKGIFAVLAEWEKDTHVIEGKPYRAVCEPFKLLQIDDAVPAWIFSVGETIAQTAWTEGFLDNGYINPDYATPEQESQYYKKHREEIVFKMRCMIALKFYEELEYTGMLPRQEWRSTDGERRDDRRDGAVSDTA